MYYQFFVYKHKVKIGDNFVDDLLDRFSPCSNHAVF